MSVLLQKFQDSYSNTTNIEEDDNTQINEVEENVFDQFDEPGIEISPIVSGSQEGATIDIAPPSTSVYDGMTMEQANEYYEGMKARPFVKEQYNPAILENELLVTNPNDGTVTKLSKPTPKLLSNIPYLGTFIKEGTEFLNPDAFKDYSVDTSIESKVVGGLTNQARNAIETGAAVIDGLSRLSIFSPIRKGEGTNLTSINLTSVLPKQAYGGSLADAAISEIPGFLVSFLVGDKGTKSLFDLSQMGIKKGKNKINKNTFIKKYNNSKLAQIKNEILKEISPTTNRLVQFSPRKVAGIIGGEAMVAATLDKDTTGLAFGEGSMLGTDFGFEPGSEEYSKILTAKTNLLLDGLLATGVFTTSVKGVVQIPTVINKLTLLPIIKGFSQQADDFKLLGVTITEGKKKELVRNMLNDLSRLKISTTFEEQRQLQLQILQAMQNNKQFFIQLSENNGAPIDVALTTMNAIIKSDTLPNNVRIKAQRIQQGVTTTDPSVNEAAKRPLIQLRDLLDDLFEQGGGEGATNEGAKLLIDQVNTNIAKKTTTLGEDISRLAFFDQLKEDAVFENPAIIKQIARLLDKDPTQILNAKGEARDAVFSILKSSYADDLATNRELYSKITGGDILKSKNGAGQFFNKMRENLQLLYNKETDVFTDAKNAITNTSFMKLLNLLEGGPDGSLVGKNKSTINKELRKFIEDNNIDYAYLFNTVRSEANKIARNAYNQMSNPSASALYSVFSGLVKFIDGEGLEIISKFDKTPGFKETAEAAINHTKTVMGPKWRDGLLKELEPIRKETIARGDDFGVVTFESEGKQIIEDILKSGQTDNTNLLIEVLEKAQPNSKQNVLAYIIQDSIVPMYNQLKQGNIDNFNVDDFTNKLAQYGKVLEQNFPESAMELNNLVQKFNRAKGNSQAQQNLVDQSFQMVKQYKSDIESSILGKFIADTIPDMGGGANLTPVSNGLKAFEDILNSQKDAVGNVNRLLEFADNDPILVKAMQNAWLSNFRKKIFDVSKDESNAQAITQSQFEKINLPGNEIIEIGETLFKDEPIVLAAINELTQIGDLITRASRGKPEPIFSPTAQLQETTAAVNRLIYFTFGVLSSAGTKSRAVFGAARDRLITPEFNKQVLAELLKDPDEFIRQAEMILKDPAISPELQRQLEKSIARTYLYTSQDDQMENLGLGNNELPPADELIQLGQEMFGMN